MITHPNKIDCQNSHEKYLYLFPVISLQLLMNRHPLLSVFPMLMMKVVVVFQGVIYKLELEQRYNEVNIFYVAGKIFQHTELSQLGIMTFGKPNR